MDLKIVILREVRQISDDFTYMCNLKKKMVQMNLFTKQKWGHTVANKMMDAQRKAGMRR